MNELCRRCQGACCRNIRLVLSPTEVDFLTRAGTVLRDISPGMVLQMYDLKARLGGVVLMIQEVSQERTVVFLVDTGKDQRFFSVQGDCGCLEVPRPNEGGWRPCRAFEDIGRPEACHSVVPGESVCQMFRESRLQP